MTSLQTVAIDLAWGGGLLVLGALLLGQVRRLGRLRRQAEAPPEPELPDSDSPVDAHVGVRRRIRCPRCTRAFDVHLRSGETSTTVSCPSCGLTAPYTPPAGASQGARASAGQAPPGRQMVGPAD